MQVSWIQAGDKGATAPLGPTQTAETTMVHAKSITTAIREVMSRGQPLKSTNRVRAAHTAFVAALAGNAPQPNRSGAYSEALEASSDHLERTIAVLHVYVRAIIAETARETSRRICSITATSMAYSNNFRQTCWAQSAMLRLKCGCARIGGPRDDPPIRYSCSPGR